MRPNCVSDAAETRHQDEAARLQPRVGHAFDRPTPSHSAFLGFARSCSESRDLDIPFLTRYERARTGKQARLKGRYAMEQPRMQQTMPEDRSGWHQIDAGPHLEVLFHPNR